MNHTPMNHPPVNHTPIDLTALARQEMTERGFAPDLPAAAAAQAATAKQQHEAGLEDLTAL